MAWLLNFVGDRSVVSLWDIKLKRIRTILSLEKRW